LYLLWYGYQREAIDYFVPCTVTISGEWVATLRCHLQFFVRSSRCLFMCSTSFPFSMECFTSLLNFSGTSLHAQYTRYKFWVDLWCKVVINIQFTLYGCHTCSPFKAHPDLILLTHTKCPPEIQCVVQVRQVTSPLPFYFYPKTKHFFFALTSPRLFWKYDLFDSNTNSSESCLS
jgi:hypothetical protein